MRDGRDGGWRALARGFTRAIAAIALLSLASLVIVSPAIARVAQGPDDDVPYRGRRVADVLTSLQTHGVRILFSSALVAPTLVVNVEPRGRTPRQIAAEILAPHGLTLKGGPGGTWLVVRMSPGLAPLSPAKTADAGAAPSPAGAGGVAAPTLLDPQAPRIEEEIQVTEPIHELAGQVSVKSLDVRTVRETAGGFENPLQVLSLLPGVAATDDEEGKMAVRGAGPQHNMLVFDGVQMHNPQRFGDFTTSFINPATAASIALDASGLDARYGGRLSSVLVLETRDGRTDRRFAFSGSAGLTSGDVLVEGRLPGTRSGSWWATARGTYYRYVASRFRDGVLPSFSDVQFKVTVRPTRHTRLSIVGLVGNEGKVDPLNVEVDPFFVEGNISSELETDNRLAAANLWWTPGPRIMTVTTLTGYVNDARYQHHWRTNNTGSLIDGPEGPFDRRVRIADVGARQRVRIVWAPGHVLDAGVEVHRLRNTWDMTGALGAPWSGSVGPNVWGELIDYRAPLDIRMARTQIGTWLQERVPIGSWLELEPGLRLDWNSFTDEHAVQPRLRATKRIGETTVWGGVAWQSQAPGLETMQQGLQFFDFTRAEAPLRNERSRQVVVGVERTLGSGITVRVEAYRRWFDRLLVQRLETEEERQHRLLRYVLPPDLPSDDVHLEYRPTVFPQSVGTGRGAGLELLVQRDRGRITGSVAYTLGTSERDLYGRTVPFDFDRRHTVSGLVQVQVASRVRVAATTQFATGFPMTPAHEEVSFVRRPLPDGSYDPLFRAGRINGTGPLLTQSIGYPFRLSLMNSARMRAYARTDVRVTYALGRHWEVYGEVINLFNRENFREPWTVETLDGTFIQIGSRPVYPNHPRLPTYGLRVTF